MVASTVLEMELKIQDGTVRLSKTPAAKRTRQFIVKAGKLSLNQRKVVLEVDKNWVNVGL